MGGLTSFLSSWLGQSGQLRAQLLLQDKGRRQELYRSFVEEASQLYIDALISNAPDLSKIILLYAQISRMRIVSSAKVIEEARKVARLIIESYPAQNKTFDDVREMVHEHALDPLRDFAQACREEFGATDPMSARPN